MYANVDIKIAAGNAVILDGGTGTEIQARGVPMDSETWCAEANRSHPEVVRAVHEAYLAAGADVITANTYATSPILFKVLGRENEVAEIDRLAVRLAREAVADAGADQVAIAGSFSIMGPHKPGTDSGPAVHIAGKDLMPLFAKKAQGLADSGCDLILMEMMRDCDTSLWATEAAVAAGLPVWVGIAVERRADGRLAGFGRHDWELKDIVTSLMSTGAKACLVMHNDIGLTEDALHTIKANWAGPIGAYPESGHFAMPNWTFGDITPADFVEQARRWHRIGATIIGGCCGIGPKHIAALAKAFGARK
jgi:S-methylmethionine-dependent homocysteine/selenocysteine methylase